MAYDRAYLIAAEYNYTVLFTGVGLYKEDPGGLRNGHCSQFAIFVRNDALNSLPFTPNNSTLLENYTHIETIHMPMYDEPPLSTSEIVNEIKQQFYSLRIEQGDAYTTHGDQHNRMVHLRVDFEKIWGKLRIRQLCKTRENVIQILQSVSHEFLLLPESSLKEDGVPVIIEETLSRSPSEQVWLPLIEKMYPKQPRLFVEGFFVMPEETYAEEEDLDAAAWQGTWLDED
jgi:hypothetical protein